MLSKDILNDNICSKKRDVLQISYKIRRDGYKRVK